MDDPTPDYMNLLGMIFSMCGLMLKVGRAEFPSPQLRLTVGKAWIQNEAGPVLRGQGWGDAG